MPLAALISVPFLIVFAFFPVLRRLAVRNILRRPRESALVVLGSLLGTAILTGSFVVGDTLESSLRRVAYSNLGPVDEVVTAADPQKAAQALERITALKSPRIDGALPITAMTASVGTVETPRRASPRAQLVELDFAAARTLGGDPDATGIDGATPGPGRAVVTEELADDLDVGAGDGLDVFAFGSTVRLVVDRVIPVHGLAGFQTGFGGRSLNVFVPAGTIAGLQGDASSGEASFGGFGLGSSLGVSGPQRLVAVSNSGGVEDGAGLTGDVTTELEKALTGLDAQVRTAKRDLLDGAEASGRQFSQIFTAMGSFGVIAGILLLVNIFVMLAEERRSELGMLRAVGMRRAWLVAAFSSEGWLYAIAASVLGALLGVVLGNLIAVLASRLFASFPGAGRVDLVFAAKSASIQRGFALGLLISVVTVTITSVRISRFNVIRAIRDIAEVPVHHRGARGLIVGIGSVTLGALWLLASMSSRQPFGMLLAPLLAVAGLVSLAGRLMARRPAISAGALAAIAWGVIGVRFFRESQGNSGIVLFVLQGMVLTASAVILVSQNQELVGAALRRLSGGNHALALRLGLAYPLARRFRTGMTLAMYTLVVFTLTFITVFSHMAFKQIDRVSRAATGGFDVVVTSNPTNPVTAQDIGSRGDVKGVAALQTTFAQFVVPGSDERSGAIMTGFDDGFIALGPPQLQDRGTYASDADAYGAVLKDPGLIIVPQFFPMRGGPFGGGRGGGGPSARSADGGQRRQQRGSFGPPGRRIQIGDQLSMTSPFTGTERKVRVAAIAGGGFSTQGALYGVSGTKTLAGDSVFPAVLYVAAKPGVDADRLAAELSGKFVEKGAQAAALATQAAAAQSAFLGFFGIIRGYLALGLLVGIAGLGVVMVRAVRERRRQIGVLRALGFDASTVRTSFVIESGFVALEGVLMGVGLALVTVYSLIAVSGGFRESGFQFSVPVVSLFLLVLGTLIASLLATAAPSQAAARIRPAVALRMTD